MIFNPSGVSEKRKKGLYSNMLDYCNDYVDTCANHNLSPSRKRPELTVVTNNSPKKNVQINLPKPRSQSESPRKKFFSEVPPTSFLREDAIPDIPKKKFMGGLFNKRFSTDKQFDLGNSLESKTPESIYTDTSVSPDASEAELDSSTEHSKNAQKKPFWKK